MNGTDFASYNTTYGVGALGTVGFAGYSPLLINNAASTDNVSMPTSTGVNLSNLTQNGASQTINSLRITGTTAIGFGINGAAASTDTLILNTGGLLLNNASLTLGASVNNGVLTSGGSELFMEVGTATTTTINSAITNNPATPATPVSLVRTGSGTITLAGTNNYTGGTYLNGGTTTVANSGNVTIGQSTLGTGGIFVSSGTFTQTAGAVIPSQALTIEGSTASGASAVNLSSSLSYASSVTTLNSNVITVTSTNGIAVGQLVTGTGIPGNEFVTAVNPANNTVTITSGSGVTAGTNTMNFLVNNSLTNLTFNNTGGFTAPTLTIAGLLNLPNGAITASSTNPSSTSLVTGGNIDFGNVASPTITVNPIAFNGQNVAPLQATLSIASAIQDASHAISVTGGGNLQLSGASVFTGGVNLAGGTSLTITTASTNAASGQPLSGPLGTGTLTIGTGSTLYADTINRSVGNNVVVSGNFTFDATTSAAANLTLGAGSQTIALPASAATTITVNAPNMTGILNDTVTGSGAILVKAGLGALQLNNNIGGGSTFSGGVVLNAGTLLATGVGSGSAALGSGPVVLSGGVLQLHHSGQSINGIITYGNNVDINTAQANAYIDVNNNGGTNTGNAIIMGTLDYGTVAGTAFTSTVSGNPAPGTILNVTGGNGYKLQFNGTTLTTATSSPTFNVGTGLFLILPGGFNTATNLPTNIGLGTLSYSGSNTGVVASSPITGTVAVSPATGGSSTPLGTGGITLNGGSTLQISPILGTLSTTGYTSGGVTAKYYNTGGSTIFAAANYGIAPGSTLAGVNLNDRLFANGPAGVNPAGLTNTLGTYQALLTISPTGAGTYFFGQGNDDFLNLTVDGQQVQNSVLTQQGALQSVNLSAGIHQITARYFNAGGGGGGYILYSGPDTASNGITGQPPVNNLQALPLSALSYATNYTLANSYQNAAILNNAITVQAAGSATIDGLGTDFNYAIPSLTLNGTSTLVVNNGTGTVVNSAGNGAFIVTGTTTISAAGATVSPVTGTLVLAGGTGGATAISDGGFGLTKTGAGNLILGASAGTFTGAFNISAGFVQLQDGAGLTTGTTTIGVATTTPATLDLNGQTVTTTGNIILNGGAGPALKSSNAPAGLYNSSATTASLPVGGFLSIGAATTTVNASIGGFGNINVLGTIQDSVAGSALNKVGPDTLILSNTNTFTGPFNITAGIVQLTGITGFTSSVTNAAIETAGATVDLNGQAVTTLKPLSLTGAGLTGLGIPNQLGALVNSSATNASYAGPITLLATTSIGGPNLGSGNGGITLSGVETGAFQITKIGGNNLTLTATAGAETAIDVQAGSLTLSGAGKIASTAASFIRQGATVTLDNSGVGNAVSNRFLPGGVWLSGSLNIIGNATTAVSEVVSVGGNQIAVGQTTANGYGGATITLSAAGTAGVTLQVASTGNAIFNRLTGNTALIRGDNLGSATTTTAVANTAQLLAGGATVVGLSANSGQSVGQAGQWNAPNALIYQWAVADTSASGVGIGFASYSTFGGSLNFGTANSGGVAPISINANNALATAPALSFINANTVQNNATITVASTGGLSVGQLVVGANIPANAVITAIPNATTFTISTVVNNVTGATANNTLTFYANPQTTVSNITTTASTTVTVPSTANLYVGEVVSGTSATGVATGFIPNGDTIASIVSATQFTLTTTATAGANPVLTFSLPGYANIATGTAQTFGAASAAQEQNSLTLTSGGGATINKGLQLDSGGVLAVGNADNVTATSYTIGGTGMLTGTNTLNREMVFHVTGAANTLTVNAPIYANGGGLTKADGGTLVLGTAEPYIGNTTLNGGVTKLAGGNNTLFMVYSTPTTAGNTAAGVTGQLLYVDNGATLDLAGTTQAVGNLLSGSGTQLAGGTILNSTGTATLHIAQNQTTETWAGNISNSGAGTLNFVRDGNNTFIVNSPNTFSGTFTQTGGATTLTDLGTFQNASAVNVTRAALIWNDQGTQAVSNRLGSGNITLTGGGLQFLTRAGTGSNPTDAISLGTLNLGIGESNIVVSSVGQGGAASVTFAGLGTRATGSTLSFGGITLSAGDNPRYFFTSAPALTNGIIGAWATVNTVSSGGIGGAGGPNIGFATYDAASGVRVLQYQPNATYGAGVNTEINASATIPAALDVATTTTVNSVSIYNATLSFTNAFDTLVVQSGGLLSGTSANGVIGSVATPGIIKSGSGNDLYIHNGSNTFTINSQIIDNGSSNNVIIDGVSNGGSTTTFTNANTYGGTTYLSGETLTLNSLLGPAIPHDIVLSGGNNASTDSLAFNATNLNFALPNQLASSSNVTMNGATQINLGGATNGLVANSQTIANLTFNNDGGSNGANGPTIFTQAGLLTINGTITSTNNTESFSIPTVNGFVSLTTGAMVVNANAYVPNQVGLALNANVATGSAAITLTGTGWLALGGQSQNYLQPINVNTTGGGVAIGSGTGGASGVVFGSQIILSAGTTLDTRGNTGTIGSLASASTTSVLENGLQGTAGTLVTGLDNLSSTFAGTIVSPFPTGLLNLTKIGTGTWTLTNDSTATNDGVMTVSGGGVTLAAAGAKIGFTTTTVNTGGTILLDNSSAATNNRLGGAFLTTTAAVLAPTERTVTLAGGNLTVNGNGLTVITENLGNVTGINGSIITLSAASTAGVNLTLESIGAQGAGTSLLIRGDNLGSTIGTSNAGAGNATVLFATAGAVTTPPGLTFPTAGGATGNNTLTKTIRPDILVSASATGLGDGFLTIDSVTGLVRALNSTTELQTTPTQALGYTISSTTTVGTLVTVGSTAGLVVGEGVTLTNVPANDFIASIVDGTHYNLSVAATLAATNLGTYAVLAATQNVKTSAVTPLFANATVNSITLGSGGGFSSGIIAGNPWGSNGGLLTLTDTSTGVLSTAGSNTIAVGEYAYGGITADIHVLTGSTLNMNSVMAGSTGGFTKSDGGTMILNQPFFGNNAQTVSVNGGTLQFGANVGANPLWLYTAGASAPSAENLAVNSGTLDLNGINQVVGTVTSTNPLPFGGGTSGSPNIIITNSNLTTAATFTTNAANSVFSGEFTGNLNLDKAGPAVNVMTLTSPQTYTGTTTVRGGILVLRDSASIASTAAINLNSAALQVDNTGLSDSTTRIPTAAQINLAGGTLKFLESERIESVNLGTLALASGDNELSLINYNGSGNTSGYTVNIANLTQSNSATLNIFTNVNGALGNFSGANNHIYLTQLNGTTFNAASMVDGIIAPWLTVNQGDWATYSNVAGITTPNANGTANYTNTTLTTAVPADNVSLNTATTGGTFAIQGVTARTINTLAVRAPAETTVIGLNGPLDQLVIASGGVILNTGVSVAIQGGSITAGAANSPSTLYLNAFSSGTTTFNSPIVNNGTGALSLVRSGGGAVTLTPEIVESLTVAQIPISSTTITVPNSTGLVVGMGVSGTGITAGSTITAIAGNVITLSAATSGTVNTATAQWIASARCSASAWEETSIAHAVSPPSSIAANVAWSSIASGVVRTVGQHGHLYHDVRQSDRNDGRERLRQQFYAGRWHGCRRPEHPRRHDALVLHRHERDRL